ncbi:hypothetical protein O181_002905 [Austropuccinia psidii MF-1]|uniref:Uncharacterized protein n=1 Tax=Austropuccinia psidii MF-1 TaxID=1389203 RepID=A0A9Q3BDC9_9BASI|nr:hypothetical protein [Austropuccinia psidii MF-1]
MPIPQMSSNSQAQHSSLDSVPARSLIHLRPKCKVIQTTFQVHETLGPQSTFSPFTPSRSETDSVSFTKHADQRPRCSTRSSSSTRPTLFNQSLVG